MPTRVRDADGVVLPGVGAFRDAAGEAAPRTGSTRPCARRSRRGGPTSGCVSGSSSSSRRATSTARRRASACSRAASSASRAPGGRARPLRVPHIGWNEVRFQGDHALTRRLPARDHFYFVHAYRAVPRDAAIVAGVVDYGAPFAAAVAHENVFAVQFHPEKSQDAGRRVLDAFRAWITCDEVRAARSPSRCSRARSRCAGPVVLDEVHEVDPQDARADRQWCRSARRSRFRGSGDRAGPRDRCARRPTPAALVSRIASEALAARAFDGGARERRRAGVRGEGRGRCRTATGVALAAPAAQRVRRDRPSLVGTCTATASARGGELGAMRPASVGVELALCDGARRRARSGPRRFDHTQHGAVRERAGGAPLPRLRARAGCRPRSSRAGALDNAVRRQLAEQR